MTTEAVLIPATAGSPSPLKHRILGTISFDTPFLGMHPGIIKAGLGSWSRCDPSPPGTPGAGTEGANAPSQLMDPNYNPAFFNDTRLPMRSAWRGVAHFVNKHSGHLKSATKQLVTSHIDFGRCMGDYDGLKVRYCRIRMLEEEDSKKRETVIPGYAAPPRVRFVNYYTVSNGRPRRPKSPVGNGTRTPVPDGVAELRGDDSVTPSQHSPSFSRSSEKPPVVTVEDSDGSTTISDVDDLDIDGLDSLDDLESNFDDQVSMTDGRVPKDTKPPPFEAPTRPPLVPLTSPPPQSDISTTTRADSLRIEPPPQNFDLSQPGLPPEPQAPGPVPTRDQFESANEYRSMLREHGQASKTYFTEAKKRQQMLFETFINESKARTSSYNAEIARMSGLIGQEAVRFGEAAAENARIQAEIYQEQIKSLVEHRRLVAQYRFQCMGHTPDDTKKKLKLDRADAKLAEKQAKVEKKAAEENAKSRRKAEKLQAKLQKSRCKASSSKASKSGKSVASQSSTIGHTNSLDTLSPADSAESAFFEATEDLEGPYTLFGAQETASPSMPNDPSAIKRKPLPSSETSHNYDLNTAPIADSITHLRSSNSDSSDQCIQNPSITPSASTSQVSLSTANGTLTPSSSHNSSNDPLRRSSSSAPSNQPRKEKKFCNLPPADAQGHLDPTWVKVQMGDVDEVGAHCGLFYTNAISDGPTDANGWSERYSGLVADVSERVEGWVGEEMSRLAVEGWRGV